MRYPLIIRRIVGESMMPTLRATNLVVATGLYRHINKRDIVIFEHRGIDKIKRIEEIRGSEFYVLGDNASASQDSRDFGWLNQGVIKAKVVWPRVK
jgi:signal peptidase I